MTDNGKQKTPGWLADFLGVEDPKASSESPQTLKDFFKGEDTWEAARNPLSLETFCATIASLLPPAARSTGISNHIPNAPPCPTTPCLHALASLSAENNALNGTSIEFKSELDAFAAASHRGPDLMIMPKDNIDDLDTLSMQVFDDNTMGPDLMIMPKDDIDDMDTLSMQVFDDNTMGPHLMIIPREDGDDFGLDFSLDTLFNDGLDVFLDSNDRVDAQSKVSAPTDDSIIHEGKYQVDALSKVSAPTKVSAPPVPSADVATRTHPYLSVFSEEDLFYGNPSNDPKVAEAVIAYKRLPISLSAASHSSNSVDAMYDVSCYGL
eukprot:gene32790-33856_t